MGECFRTAEWFRPDTLIEWFRSHLPVEIMQFMVDRQITAAHR
jgi:hypothetical protein